MRRLLTIGCVSLGMLVSTGLAAPQDAPAKPDNTKVNKQDRDHTQPTADKQKENKSDRELTRNIRRAIVKDKSLSTYAHNVKIISQNGEVTLKGPVRSEDEKKAVEAKASSVASSATIHNELTVAPSNSADRAKTPEKH